MQPSWLKQGNQARITAARVEMGACCPRRRIEEGSNELVGRPAPSRPMYDEAGEAVEQSPRGSRRRLNKTDPEQLPRLGEGSSTEQ